MNKKKSNSKKAVMIGCGFVGSASVFALMQSGLFTEIALIDADKNKAEGEAMDISHGIPFASPMKIYAGDYDDVADAAIVIISAGAGQKPGETRLDLVNKNVAIFKSIIQEITKRDFGGILLVVANPVDILTRLQSNCQDFRRKELSAQEQFLTVQDLEASLDSIYQWTAEVCMHL